MDRNMNYILTELNTLTLRALAYHKLTHTHLIHTHVLSHLILVVKYVILVVRTLCHLFFFFFGQMSSLLIALVTIIFIKF